jgi:hypothetical protein
MVVREDREPAHVADGEFDRVMQQSLEQATSPEARARAELRYQQMPRHESFPAFGEVMLDAAGNVWVMDYERPGIEQRSWRVFDREGFLIARVVTPAELRLLEIGDDYVLGVHQDDLHVERVRLYRLEKQGA